MMQENVDVFGFALNDAAQRPPEQNATDLQTARDNGMTPGAVREQGIKPDAWMSHQELSPAQRGFFIRNRNALSLLYDNPKSLKLADAMEKASDKPKEKEPEWKSFEKIDGVEAGQWDGNTAIDEYVESQLKEYDKTHPKPSLRKKRGSRFIRGGSYRQRYDNSTFKALEKWEAQRKAFEKDTRLAARRSWIRDFGERFGDMDDATFQQAKMILQRTGGFYPNVLNKLKDAVASGNVVEAMTSDDIHKALNLPGAKRNPFMQWKIAKYAEDLYGRQGRMLGLMDSQYPSWRDEDEKMQTLMFNKLASEAGIDISDMSIDMIRQKGFLDSDFAAPLNAFGLRDLAHDLFNDRLSLEDGGLYRKNLKDVTAEMPPEVVGDFLSRFKNQVDTERGQTWLSSITEGVGSSLAYSLEFMIMNAMLPGGGSQIGKILKPLTLAKDAEGYVARWTPEGIKLMLKALGVDAVETTAKNVGLPMLAKTALATEKRDADDRFPLLFQNENGETVRVENDQIDPWIVKFGQEFIGNWIEHFTENLGEFLPEMPWEKSVKNLGLGLKDNMTAAQKVALVEKALKNSGFTRAADKVLELSGWNGFTAEMFEEYASKFARALLTDASKAVDMPVLDMKENSYLGDLAELRDTAVTVALQSLLMNGLHLATNSALRKRIEKDIMASNRVREALKDTGLVEQDVETAKETLKTEGTFEGKKVYLRTVDVAALMQKHGEFFSRIGVSEDEVDDAMRNGEPTMAFNLGDLTIEGARAEGGEEFYKDVVGHCFDDVTLKEKQRDLDKTAEAVKQWTEQFFNRDELEKRKKQVEENKEFVDEMVGKVANAVRTNPATNYEVEKAGRMFTTLLNMNTNTGATMEQRKEYADNILNSYLENPEAFTGDYVKKYSAFLKDGVVQTLANLFGVKLHVWTDAELEEEKKLRSQVDGGISDFAIHGKYKDGTIYINPHSNQAYMRIFGHELNHFFKQSAPELYQSLKEVFDEAVRTAEGERSQMAQALWDKISRTYPEFKDSLDDLQEEYQGDLLGMMFTDRKFLGTLAEALERKKQGMGALLLEKMRDVLLHILRYLGGIGRYESIQMFNDVSRLYNDISDLLADYAEQRVKSDVVDLKAELAASDDMAAIEQEESVSEQTPIVEQAQEEKTESTEETERQEGTGAQLVEQAPDVNQSQNVMRIVNERKETRRKNYPAPPAINESDPESIKAAKRANVRAHGYHPGGVALPDGMYYAIIPLRDAIVSVLGEKGYEQFMQNRFEGFARLNQVADIGSHVRADELTEGTHSDLGTPVVVVRNGKMSVVSGNGRTKGLFDMYRKQLDREYRETVMEWAVDHGYTFDESMENPILVRVLPDGMTQDEIEDYVSWGNDDRNLSKSDEDMAYDDMGRLRRRGQNLLNSYHPENESLINGSNREFAMRFYNLMSKSHGDMAPNGNPTHKLEERIQRLFLALLFKNLEKQEVEDLFTSIMSASSEHGVTKTINGIMQQSIQLGRIADESKAWDIAPELSQALDLLMQYKVNPDLYSGNIENFINTPKLGDTAALDENVANLLRGLNLLTNNATDTARMFQAYLHAADNALHSDGMLFSDNTAAQTKGAAITAMLETAKQLDAEKNGGKAAWMVTEDLDWGDETRVVPIVGEGKAAWTSRPGVKTSDMRNKLLPLAVDNLKAQDNYLYDQISGHHALKIDDTIFCVTQKGLFHGAGRRLKYLGPTIARIGDVLNASVEVPIDASPWHYRIASVNFGQPEYVLLTTHTMNQREDVVSIQSLYAINARPGSDARTVTSTSTAKSGNVDNIAHIKAAWQEIFAKNLSSHIAEHIEKSSKIGEESSDGKYFISNLYTGSAADYEKPSLHYVGTGEGQQVFGYGLYSSSNRGIGEWYAEEDFKRKQETPNIDITYKGKRFQYMRNGEQYSELHGPEHEAARLIFNHNGDIDAAWSDAMDVYSNARRAYEEKPDEHNGKFKEYQGKIVDLLFEGQDSWKVEKHELSHNLYRQTWFTNRVNNGEANLLDWNSKVPQEQKEQILDALSLETDNEKILDFIRERWRREGLNDEEIRTKSSNLSPELLKKELKNFWRPYYFRITEGQDIYNGLRWLLGSPKAVSEFLFRTGIDGIRYPAASNGTGDGSKGWNYVSFSDTNMRVDEHEKWSITERDKTLEGVTEESLLPKIIQKLDDGIEDKVYKAKEKDSILTSSMEFFRHFAQKVIPLSTGGNVYFMPSPKGIARLGNDNIARWAEYCVHQVTSGGSQIPGSVKHYRNYSEEKIRNLDYIESIVKNEIVKVSRGELVFFGKGYEDKDIEVVTHPDEEGNFAADLSEVTLRFQHKEENPPPKRLAEVVKDGVVSRDIQAPLTSNNVQPSPEKSSDGGSQSDFSSQGDTENAPDFSSQGGKNLITRSGVESVFRKLGGEENPSVAAFASHNAALEALKGADGVTVWKTMAQPLRELAADLVSRQLAVPQLEEALPALEGIADIGGAFERYMDEGTAHDEAMRDALSALKMLLLSVWQGNGQTMEVDDDVRTELDARLAAGECVGNMLPLADVRAALKALEGTGVPGNGLPYDTLHLLQRVETQIRDRQEQYLKRTLNTLRRVWRGDAKELMAQDRDYQAWERIKAGGGLDYNMVKTLVGKERTKQLRERGLLSKVADSVNAAEIDYNNLEESKTVNPYELFGSLGYTDVFEMVDALLKMATPTAFVKEYVNQNSEEWIQGQGWKLDEEALGNSQVIDGVRLLEKMLAEKTNWPLFSQSFKNDAYNRVHAMKVSDIISDNKALTDARMLVNDIVHAAGKKEADAGAIMDAVGALRLQLEILRQKAALKKDVGRIQRKMLKDAHAQKGTIHSFYHDALKELAYVFGVSKAEPETSDGRQRAKTALETKGEDDTMEPRVWGDWLLSSEKRRFSDLSVAEFEELADFVRAVSGVGRSLVTEDKQSIAARNAETLQSFLTDNEDKPHKYTKHADAGAIEKVKHYVNQFNAIWSKLWRFMGEAGPTMRRMYDTLSEAAYREMELRQKTVMALNKAMDEIAPHLGEVNLDNLPALPENSQGYQKWSPEMVIMAVLHMGTETGRQRLRDGFGWTDAQLNQIASALPSAILSQLNNVWQIMGRGEMTQADREEFLKENYYELKTLPPVEFQVLGSDGVTVDMTGGYVPISYLYSNRGHDVTIGYNAMAVYATPSSIHERAQEIRDVAPLVLSWGTLLSNISDRCHYSTHRLALRDIFAVVTNKDFRRTYGETQSFERYAAMMQILRHIANPTQDEHKALNFLERFGKSMLVPCSLAFNLSSVGMQLTSLTVGSLEQGGHFGRAVLSMCIHPLETMAAAREKSPMMRERADMIDIDMHKATTIFNQSKLKKVQETFNLLGYYMMKTVDSFVATIDFTAAYEKAIAEGKDEAAAIAYAEDFVARTQGATRAMDVSTVSLSPLGRMITPFFTAVCAQQNVAAHDLFDADKNAMQKAMATTLNLLLPALMAGAIRFLLAGGAGDDDDKKERARTAMIREIMQQPVAGIPVLRDVVDFAAGQMMGRKGGSVIEAGWVEAINETANLIGEGVKAADEGAWQYTCYITADAVSRMLRVPLVVVYSRQQRLLENLGIDVPNLKKKLKGK